MTHIFESHHEFYSVIQNQDQLLKEYPNLGYFKYFLHLTKSGCNCDLEVREQLALNYYRDIASLDSSAFDKIKLLVDAEHLVFKLDEQELFSI